MSPEIPLKFWRVTSFLKPQMLDQETGVLHVLAVDGGIRMDFSLFIRDAVLSDVLAQPGHPLHIALPSLGSEATASDLDQPSTTASTSSDEVVKTLSVNPGGRTKTSGIGDVLTDSEGPGKATSVLSGEDDRTELGHPKAGTAIPPEDHVQTKSGGPGKTFATSSGQGDETTWPRPGRGGASSGKDVTLPSSGGPGMTSSTSYVEGDKPEARHHRAGTTTTAKELTFTQSGEPGKTTQTSSNRGTIPGKDNVLPSSGGPGKMSSTSYVQGDRPEARHHRAGTTTAAKEHTFTKPGEPVKTSQTSSSAGTTAGKDHVLPNSGGPGKIPSTSSGQNEKTTSGHQLAVTTIPGRDHVLTNSERPGTTAFTAAGQSGKTELRHAGRGAKSSRADDVLTDSKRPDKMSSQPLVKTVGEAEAENRGGIVPATSTRPIAPGVESVSVSGVHGQALPPWLTFDPTTQTFSGTPTGGGDLPVEVHKGGVVKQFVIKTQATGTACVCCCKLQESVAVCVSTLSQC